VSATQVSTLTATLLAGTPALTFLGAIGAALTATLRRGGLLTAILILPLAIPVLIFGKGLPVWNRSSSSFKIRHLSASPIDMMKGDGSWTAKLIIPAEVLNSGCYRVWKHWNPMLI
jgi:hypothetical protein